MGTPERPNSLSKLQQILTNIALPKSKTAKTVSVPLEIFLEAKTLATNALEESKASHPSDFNTLCQKIDTLTQLVDANSQRKPASTYANIVKQTIPNAQGVGLRAFPFDKPPPLKNYHVTLGSSSYKCPMPLYQKTIPEIQQAFNALMVKLDFRASPDQPVVTARTVTKLRNGDIRFYVRTKKERDALINRYHRWFSALDEEASFRDPAFRVVVHGMPTSFSPEAYSRVIPSENLPPHLQADYSYEEWISKRPKNQAQTQKTHSTLVIILNTAEAANYLIAHQVAYQGQLLRTEKYRSHLLQCYNCQHFGHLARDCKQPPACGHCAGNHSTKECCCSSVPACSDLQQCQHIVQKCALCTGPHRAAARSCPRRKEALECKIAAHLSTGLLFPV